MPICVAFRETALDNLRPACNLTPMQKRIKRPTYILANLDERMNRAARRRGIRRSQVLDEVLAEGVARLMSKKKRNRRRGTQ